MCTQILDTLVSSRLDLNLKSVRKWNTHVKYDINSGMKHKRKKFFQLVKIRKKSQIQYISNFLETKIIWLVFIKSGLSKNACWFNLEM